jgi:hypothetical protein
MDLPLTKIGETGTTITLKWTPILCMGYVFYRNGTRVSNTWNSMQSQIRFAKGTSYRVVAIGAIAEGTYPSSTPSNSEAYSAEPYTSGPYSK